MFIQKYDDEMKELAKQFHEMFEDSVPRFQIPASETLAGLKKNVRKCIEKKENLLEKMYKIDNTNDY